MAKTLEQVMAEIDVILKANPEHSITVLAKAPGKTIINNMNGKEEVRFNGTSIGMGATADVLENKEVVSKEVVEGVDA